MKSKSKSHVRSLLVCVAVLAGPQALLTTGCSSKPTKPDNGEPEWIHASARTVDNGYIVFVSSGEDRFGERARFKAEGAALQDLANECSFVPKGARLEDRFERMKPSEPANENPQGEVLHEAFAKVGIEFQVCEEAKKTIDPEAVRKIANVAMTSQVQKYQDMVGEPNDLEVDPELTKTASVTAPANPNQTTSGAVGGYSGPPPLIHSDEHFFLVRQEVAYQKQTVILAPPATYQPNTPATQKYMTLVQAPTEHLAVYEKSNPTITKSPQTWSSTHQRAQSKVADPVLSQEHRQQAHPGTKQNSMKPGQAPQSYPKGAPRGGRGRRRRGR